MIYTNWTVLKEIIIPKNRIRRGKLKTLKIKYCFCRCICGAEKHVELSQLKNGNSKGCGCTRKIQKSHGMSKSKFYGVWRSIHHRTKHPKHASYKLYSSKNISVCERWNKFENFQEDMLPTYKEGLTLDRIDGMKDYSPENCRWVNDKIQQSNKILKPSKTGVVGVYFCNKNFSYICSYKINGRKSTKAFHIKKHGLDKALQMAIDFRKQYVKYKNEVEGYEFKQ